MCWEQLFAFSDNPLEKEPSPLFNTTNTYILGDRQATDARTTEQYQQQQQNSINNNRTVSITTEQYQHTSRYDSCGIPRMAGRGPRQGRREPGWLPGSTGRPLT